MALVTFIKEWIHNRLSVLNCALHGHNNVTVIEKYQYAWCMKNFLGSDLRKFRLVNPYAEVAVQGKLRCNTCGCVFLGIIVKDKMPVKIKRNAQS